MNINILVCDWFEGLLPECVPTFPHLFYRLFDAVSPSVTYTLYDVQKGEFPVELHKDEVYLVAGSRAGAYEDKVWVKNLLRFIQEGYENKLKLAGICFGHQAIAQALGGKVLPSPKGWGGGTRTSEVTHPQGRDHFPDGKLSLYYNHNDQVVELPPMAERIATSDFCENEAFLIGNHVLCFQGHPEYTKEYMEHVIDIATDKPLPTLTAAGASLTQPVMNERVARWIMEL